MSYRRVRVAAAFAAVASLALVAATAGNAQRQTVTLRMGAYYATKDGQDTLNTVIKAFEAQHRDINIDVQFTPLNQYDQVMGTQIASGSLPDLVMGQPGTAHPTSIVAMARKGVLLDVSSQRWTAEIPAGFRSLVAIDKKVFAWPQDFFFMGAVYNMTTLAKAGVSIPQTFSQVLTYCQKMKAAGVAPYVIDLADVFGGYQLLYSLVATTVYKKTPNWDQLRWAKKTTFAKTAGWTQAFNLYARMRTSGCFQDSPNGTNIVQTEGDLFAGKAGGWPIVTSVLTQVRNAAPSQQFAAAPFPAADSNNAITGGAGTAWAISAKTGHRKQALAFLQFMAKPSVNRYWARLNGLIPTVDLRQLRLGADWTRYKPYLSKNLLEPLPGLNWPAGVQDTTLGPQIQALFLGSQSIGGLLSALDSGWNTAAGQ
jgi:ABC-type glycerol-3-phosphate transport system substrate-binding protein